MDSHSIPQTAQPAEERRKRRRGGFARFAIAGLAVVGIGGALTAAAWVVDAQFTAPAGVAQAPEFQASLTEGDWESAEDGRIAIEIPGDVFADLTSESGEVSVPVWVRNNGTTPLALSVEHPETLFGNAEVTVTSESTGSLAATSNREFTITVDATALTIAQAGQSANLIVTISAEHA